MSKNIFVVSHRRSGTHLTIDAIRNNFEACGAEHLNLDKLQDCTDVEIAEKCLTTPMAGAPRIVKSHSPAEIEDFFLDRDVGELVRDVAERSKLIYVFRDGRDVLTSFYYYAREVKPHLRSVPFGRFLRMPDPLGTRPAHPSVGNVTYWTHHVSKWIAQPDILPISFESLVLDFDTQICRLAEYLEQPIPGSITEVVRSRGDGSLPSGFRTRMREKLTKMYLRLARGVDLTSVHFRKGQIGAFQDTFSARDFDYFNEVAGTLMSRLQKMPQSSISATDCKGP